MNKIKLHGQWLVKAPLNDVFRIVTDFEKFPERFPKVAESIHIKKQEGNCLEMDATVRSFGKSFQVKMKTRILPGKGFISDNDSFEFGTSGHEELLLSEHPEGTLIDYTYQVAIQKKMAAHSRCAAAAMVFNEILEKSGNRPAQEDPGKILIVFMGLKITANT